MYDVHAHLLLRVPYRPLASHDPRQVHNSVGLALAVCQRGVSVSFTTAAALVHELP